MLISVRNVGDNYCEYTIDDGNTKIVSGLLDLKEAHEAARELILAASSLLNDNKNMGLSDKLFYIWEEMGNEA